MIFKLQRHAIVLVALFCLGLSPKGRAQSTDADSQRSSLELRLPTLTMATSRGHDATIASGETGLIWWFRPQHGFLIQAGPAGNLGTFAGAGSSARLAWLTKLPISNFPGLEIPWGLSMRWWRLGVIKKVASPDAEDYASTIDHRRIGTIETLDLGLHLGAGLAVEFGQSKLQVMLAEFHLPALVLRSTGIPAEKTGHRAERHARSVDWSLLRISLTMNLN